MNLSLKHILKTYLFENKLPNKQDIIKYLKMDDVKDYFGNTDFYKKTFRDWANDKGEFSNAEIYKGRIVGNYTKNNVKYGLRYKTGKTYQNIAYLYIPKELIKL